MDNIDDMAHRFALNLMRAARQNGLRMKIGSHAVATLKDQIADWLEKNSVKENAR